MKRHPYPSGHLFRALFAVALTPAIAQAAVGKPAPLPVKPYVRPKDVHRRVVADKIVALQGTLALGNGPVPLIDFEADEDRDFSLTNRLWQVVLGGGQPVEIRFRTKRRPDYLAPPSRVQSVLARSPSNVIVSGKVTNEGYATTDYLMIEDAKICRLVRDLP